MSSNTAFFPRMFQRRAEAMLVLCVLLGASGCSPKDADAAAAGVKSPVTIVRESKPEFPAQALAAYRELLGRCVESRSELARQQGWAYDPKADAMTDAAILALNTEKTEEYFSGKQYAVITTGTRWNTDTFGAVPDRSCKLTSVPYKAVKIRDGDCHSIDVEYDVPNGTGSTTELKGLCDKPSPPAIDRSGDTAAVGTGGLQCKWNKADSSPLHIPTCTLLPNPVHAGTGRELVAIRKSVNGLRASGETLGGTDALSFQSLVMVEQASLIDVGGAIAAAKFAPPADSAGFPVTQLK